MPKLLSPSFIADLPEITTSNYFEKKKRYHRNGLFSEHIFGLENNYTCRCGIYHGKFAEGQVCNEKICGGLTITNSIKRRRQYAKIMLPIPVLNRTFIALMKKVLSSEKEMFGYIEKLMKNDKTFIYEDEKTSEIIFCQLTDTEEISDITDKTTYQMHDAVEKMVNYIVDEYMITDPSNQDLKMIKRNIKLHLFKDHVIVIPPALRPISQINPTTNSVDQLNSYYYQLLVRKEIMEAGDIDVLNHISVYRSYYWHFQYVIDELHEYVIENISKKEGLIRGNILGKRIDFSGRAVIAPDPTIELDECILPYKMVLELYKIPIAKKLISIGDFKLIHHALDHVEKCKFHNNDDLLEICKEVIGEDVCFLNRQPSLHKLSMVAFKIKVQMSNVIYIHPLVCHGFNADFDGDCVWSKCRLRRLEHPDYIGEIADLKDTEMFEIMPEKEKENVSHYVPTEELYIKAISLDDGSIEEKKILDYSEHRNLKMFSINDPQNRFEKFWVSDDHSLIVWDENEQKNLKISPEELLENPEGRYFVQQKY